MFEYIYIYNLYLHSLGKKETAIVFLHMSMIKSVCGSISIDIAKSVICKILLDYKLGALAFQGFPKPRLY